MENQTSEPTPYQPESEREARIARLLENQYQFIRYLGRGTQSTVFAVLNKPLGRVEALKVLSDNLTQQKNFLDRFKVEAKISASLTHPNIVTIYEYKKLENFYYFTMYYVDGPMLTNFIEPSNPMPIPSICTNIATVCNAIDYAHKQGVIHRDLKTSNIMLDKSGKPYITDFGIAKWDKAMRRTQPGIIMGSPYYVSPEQAAGKEIDARSDIYSLGVTLYVLLTHKYPFKGDTPYLTIAQRLTYPPIPPEKIKPDLPKRLVKILNKSLEMNPRNRYPSAAEMAEDLTDFIISEERAPGRDATRLTRKASGHTTPSKRWFITAVALIVMAFSGPILFFLIRDDSGSSAEKHQVPDQGQARPDDKKENILNSNKLMNPPGEQKYPQELMLLIKAVEQDYLDGDFDSCIKAALAAKLIINKLPVHQQTRYAELKKKAESYQLKATKAIQSENRQKQDAESVAQVNIKPPESLSQPSDQSAKNSVPTKHPGKLKPKTDNLKTVQKNRKQNLDKLVAKIDRQYKDGDFEACLRSAKTIISIIESYDKAQQKQYAGIKTKVVNYRKKAVSEINIQNQKLSMTEAIKRKVAKGEFESAISMVDAMLMNTNLSPDVKDALLEHRKSLKMLIKKRP